MGATYALPLRHLTPTELHIHRQALRMVPKDSFSREAEPFDAYHIRDGSIHVPRWYGTAHWGEAGTDHTTCGVRTQAAFGGELKEIQRQATGALLGDFLAHAAGDAPPRPRLASPRGGMLVLGCGQGKTVCGIYVACRMRMRTLVLVHKTFLVSQWAERVRQFSNATVGIIQQNVVNVDADIVIGMVQSIAVRDYPASIFEQFGLVICDEAHHMSAPCFSRALTKIPSRYVIALSATPQRKDGLRRLLHYSMGPVIFQSERAREHVLVTILTYDTSTQRELVGRDNRPLFGRMLNRLAADDERTRVVAGHLARLLAGAPRHVIVLSDRILQLERLEAALRREGVTDVGFYIGRSSEEERTSAEKCRVILSSYPMAREGLDLPTLDTICLLSPVGDVEQAIGRILRAHPNKCTPLCIDVHDPYSLFDHMMSKRRRYYNKQGYVSEVHGTSTLDAATACFK